MIKIQNVSKSFQNQQVLDNINITVNKGTIHGLIGENGAGKTTLIQIITGIYTAYEGNVVIDEQSITNNESLKQSIGYVADSNQFFKNYRIKQLVSFYKEIYTKFDEDKFNKYNGIFKLDASKKVKQLSKGMQMRLSMMLSLATNPKVIVLDEPTSGLDAIAKKQVLEFIIQEVEENQLTVIISSHHLTELEKICDEITIINKGKVTYQSSVDNLKNQVKKLQVVFDEKAPIDLEKWEEVLCTEKIGSVYYIITKKYTNDFIGKLKQHHARIIEPIGLTLEEIFVYTNTQLES